MRVLWFTNTPSRYASFGGYNGGGWIYSLEEEISKRDDIELGIAFFMNEQPKKVEKNGVTYYPIEDPFSISYLTKIKSFFVSQHVKESIWLKNYIKIINDYAPDIIEIFGSEQSFGQVSQYVNVPVVLHIQGILTPYFNAFLPPFVSKHNYYWQNYNPLKALSKYLSLNAFEGNAKRERDILKHINNYIGRTHWDERIISIYNHNANYFYGSEILRDVFYKPVKRSIPSQVKLISTLSSPLYKGYDTVLKCASLLKNEYCLNFEWRIYGNVNPSFVEHKIGLHHQEVNVIFMGVASAEEIRKELSSSTAYIHLSYIDNSPNSVCEAQITGIPVVATNVGGIPSLINDGETGFLVPTNDPYQTAYVINKLANDNALNIRIGEKAKEIAIRRHNKEIIVNTLVETYNKIINDKDSDK